MEIEKAIMLPFSGENLKKTLIGAVLFIIPIVNFMSMGFLIDYVRNIIQKREEMPEWDDYGGYFIKGLMIFLISLIYLIIPGILIYFGLGAALLLSGIFLLLTLIGALLGLVVAFIMPMAIANYAASGNFGDAFDFGTILSRITGSLGQYLMAFGLQLVGFFVIYIINMIPGLHYILTPMVSFYIYCVVLFLVGQIYSSSGSVA